ncbi:MAG: TrmB family transcriptional regulator [Methanomicrobium sp.]|nr:TrmB family transcriptional regulator [Methanomicrobium sp.]
MPENTIRTLKNLGFTEYEARAYISLVGYGMATAREIHENSGVPQGRIYSVLKSLSEKSLIEVQDGNPSYYYAENPAAVLGRLKSELNESIDKSAAYLSNLHLDSKPPSMTWVIHSEWGIKNRVKTLIQNAEKEIIFIVDDYSFFRMVGPELKKLKRKINIEIYAKDKSDFTGTNLRVTQFNEKMLSLFRNVASQKVKNNTNPEGKITMIIDESTGFFIGMLNGRLTGVILQVPQLTYTIKAFLKMLEDE